MATRRFRDFKTTAALALPLQQRRAFCEVCLVAPKKPIVLVAATILSLIIGLAAPASAQGRGGGTGGSGAGPGGGGGSGSGGPGPGAPGSGGGPGPGGGPGRGGGPGPGGAPGRGGPVYGRGYYGYPYRGYYGSPYFYGWYGYPYFSAGWGWPYGPYPYYPYGVAAHDGSASLRLDIAPKQAEVYIDGYLAGVADDFDGSFQRLRVTPGVHELTLYYDGFKTVHQSLRLSPRSTFKVSYKMEPLAPGEVAEARPMPPPRPPDEIDPAPVDAIGRPRPQAPPVRSASGFGTVAIRVQPADAVVLIDGERWQTSSGQDQLRVDVPQGRHLIEIRKEGFEPYSTEITMAQGQTVPINVSLRSR